MAVKFQYLVDDEMWICSSYPFKEGTTLHSAERKAIFFGLWTMQNSEL